MSNPYLTKVFHFNAAHQYGHSDWTDEKNWEVFGPDSKIHGHNYILSITLKGQINPGSGFIADIKELNDVINKYVIDKFDHSQIEKDIDWFKENQPSTENMVLYIWNSINDKIPSNAILHCVKLRETPTIYSEYYGPEKE